MMTPCLRSSEIQIKLARFSEVKWYLRAILERFLPFDMGEMTSKERIKRAIEFKNPDRIPHRYYDDITIISTTPLSWQPPDGYYPYVLAYDVKFGGWRWNKRKNNRWLKENRSAIDEFGVIWNASGSTSMGEPVKGPLEGGWHLLDSYRLPDLGNPDRLDAYRRFLKLINPDRYILGCDLKALGPWELFRYLRGFENAMMDLIEHPEEVHRLLGMVGDMILDTVKNFHDAGVDGFYLLDDWGTQTSSFISPVHFREFFMPCYKKIVNRCHEFGIHCGIHSCGNIRSLVPHIIETGFDFLQLDSPNMCGLDWLAENAGGKICLFCSVDIQKIYPTNDKELIEEYMKLMIRKLARKEGGLVIWPYGQPYDIGVGARTIKAEQRIYKKYRCNPEASMT